MVVVLIMVSVSHDILIHFYLLSTSNIGVINFPENQIWYKITWELLTKCVIQYGYRMMSSVENSIWLNEKKQNFSTNNQNCYRHSFIIPSYWQFYTKHDSSFFSHIYKDYNYKMHWKMPQVVLVYRIYI